jgi:hypothetical protein
MTIADYQTRHKFLVFVLCSLICYCCVFLSKAFCMTIQTHPQFLVFVLCSLNCYGCVFDLKPFVSTMKSF